MKKALVLVSSLLFFLSVAGQALAYFEDDNLVLSIYNATTTDKEVGIDLGVIADLDFSAANVELAAAGTIDISLFNSATNADLQAGIFGSLPGYNSFFAVAQDTTPGFKTSGLAGYESVSDYIEGAYRSNSTDNVAVLDPGSLNSYDARMNNNAGSAIYANINSDPSAGEGDLGLLETQGYVDLYLYNYSVTSLVSGTGVNAGEDYVAKITLNADGSVVMNQAVPVPGAIVLMASGLIGLVGVRRRNNA